jgi:Zn-dependent M16 (insulinase) family peptidase
MAYQQVAIDLPVLDGAQYQDLSLLSDCLGEVGVGDADYIATQARMAATTGGIGARFSLRSDVDDLQGGRGLFVVSGKALVRNNGSLATLVHETLLASRFDELPRIRELIAQDRAGREAAVTGHGHALAMSAACAGFNQIGRINHEVGGLLGIRRLKTLDDALNKDGELEAFGQRLGDLAATLAAAPRQLLLVGEQQQRGAMLDAAAEVWGGANPAGDGDGRLQLEPGSGRVLAGWATNSQVRFCAKAYPTVAANHPDAPALMVLGGFLRNGFLHRTIREQGGAYGGGAGYDGDTGGFRFYSYRDPRLTGTLDDFDRAIDWLATTDHEPRVLEEAILGVIGGIDKPSTPAAEAIGAFHSSLHGRTPEQRRGFRQRVLAVSLYDLKRVGETYLIPEQASIAVVGDADTLEREGAALGLTIEEL